MLAIALSLGCVDAAPVGSESGSGDAGLDSGSLADAQSSDDASPGERDLGDAQSEPDAGSVDAGDGGTGPFYASAVAVDDVWFFDDSLASARGTFEAVEANYTDGIGGTPALKVGSGQVYPLDNTSLGFPRTDASFTVGAWIRDDDANTSAIMGLGRFQQGGWVLTYNSGSFNCLAFDSGNAANAARVEIAIDPGVWHHVACRYKRVAGSDLVDIAIVVNGQRVSETNGVPFSPSTIIEKMTIGTIETGTFEFQGSVDELFFSRKPLFGPRDIRKVWACGVSGRDCVCSTTAPADYVTCGRAVDCSALAPCWEPSD